MEPRASTPTLRLKAISDLAAAGIPVGVMVAPVIPALNDHEIERILDSARGAGATEAGYVLLRLPLEVSPLFRDWLLKHYPDRYRHVMNLVKAMRGGKDYDAEWGKRMRGAGPYAVADRTAFRKSQASGLVSTGNAPGWPRIFSCRHSGRKAAPAALESLHSLPEPPPPR